ncbi:hypothetical protein DSO57_1001067 [Entomophthora muscae]|uniref:Uncharacterized protein n=1 Tax=Entomophthora muscae TaxID=34485 RepID=A0ACC2RPB5_9FUNG|nr:hypothetical protein DSO57_1001067 [Entomophthora muscae]
MTLPLTPRPDRSLEPPAAAKTTSTQIFGVLYITLTGLVNSMVPNSGPWSLLRQSASYIIKLAPILWWALPAGLGAPTLSCPMPLPMTGFLKLDAIHQREHQASMYPAGHANIHLANVVFFNIGDTLWERLPQAFNVLYLWVLDHNSLFGHQLVVDLFAQMVFHVNMTNQS